MTFTNKEYDFWKQVCLVYLPALGTLYFALSQIWGLPYGEQIVGTISAIDTFLGVCLGISSDNYYKNKNNDNSHDDSSINLML